MDRKIFDYYYSTETFKHMYSGGFYISLRDRNMRQCVCVKGKTGFGSALE